MARKDRRRVGLRKADSQPCQLGRPVCQVGNRKPAGTGTPVANARWRVDEVEVDSPQMEVLAMFVTTRSLQRDPVINRIFDVLGSLNGDTVEASWVPPVDIFEDAEAIRIIAEVPGVKPEDVTISLEDNVLTIKGSKQQVAEERTERVHRYERTYGTFERSFTLPATVDASNIKATYEHGVLTVTLPKVEKAKPRQIEVQVASK